jgi:uncharacterized membrane protein YeiH
VGRYFAAMALLLAAILAVGALHAGTNSSGTILTLDIVATFVFSMEGGFFVFKAKADRRPTFNWRDRPAIWIGASVVAAFLLAIGGGTVRDLLSVLAHGSFVPFWLKPNGYLVVGVILAGWAGAAFLALALRGAPAYRTSGDVLDDLDGFGAGVFAVLGMEIALASFQAEAMALPLRLILIGLISMLTAAGGGILRDSLLYLPLGALKFSSLRLEYFFMTAFAGIMAYALLRGLDVAAPGLLLTPLEDGEVRQAGVAARLLETRDDRRACVYVVIGLLTSISWWQRRD